MYATTRIRTKKLEDGTFECRQGFGLFGSQNMTDSELNKLDRDPFHPEFYDNFHKGEGDTKEKTIENMKESIKSTSQSIWF